MRRPLGLVPLLLAFGLSHAPSSTTAAAAEDGDSGAPATTPPSAQAAEAVQQDLGSQVFFDARTTGINRTLNQQVFEGDVVVFGAGTLIGADHVVFDRGAGVVNATGHVVILNGSLLFLGDKVVYYLRSGDLQIDQAVLLANDSTEIEAVTRRVFGFTPAEVAFDQAKTQRLAAIEAEKSRLRRLADQDARAGAALSEEVVDRYAQLLDEGQLTSSQVNPSLRRLSPERREAMERRRAYWNKSKASAIKVGNPALSTWYFHLEGDRITRIDGNDFTAHNALFTPCRCEADETPAWAFRANNIDAQIGGYAELHHAVLEIKGIPVLYLPELRLPLKDQRQSGFLMPSAGYQPRSGNTFTQPVYFDLAPNADATLTTDFYERRGTRLGLEYRWQQREYSGWELHLEGIRDNLWLQDRALRQEAQPLYQSGLDQAAGKTPTPLPDDLNPSLSDREYAQHYVRRPDYWDQVLAARGGASGHAADNYDALSSDIDNYFAAPNNAWRGAYSWRGATMLAPRLSFVSNGEIVSDHRYAQELYVPDDFNDAFFGGPATKAITVAKGQVHLDGKDLYLGLGNQYGDDFLSSESYVGQQAPLDLKMQTRMLSLLPDHVKVPLYGELAAEQLRIAEQRPKTTPAVTPTLGDGVWKRAKFSTISPWLTDSIVQVNQFTDVEQRSIQHLAVGPQTSDIRSWRTGIELRLPIDGKGAMPAWMGADDCTPATQALIRPGLAIPGKTSVRPECAPAAGRLAGGTSGEQPQSMIHHLMDWRLRFSARPAVVRRGYYQDPAGLTYFSTDKGAGADASTIDADVNDEDRMNEHQRVTLSTDQVWKLFHRSWQAVEGATRKAEDTSGGRSELADTRARARKELLYNLEHPITDAKQIYDEGTGRFLINRYQRSDDYFAQPVTFHADIAYDFLDEKRRQQQQEQNRAISDANAGKPPEQAQPLVTPLAEAWKDPHANLGINHAGWTLNSAAQYSIYLHIARTVSMNLMTPTFFDSNAALGYEVIKEPIGSDFRRTVIRSLDFGTSLLKPVTSYISLRRKDIDGSPTNFTTSYRTALGLSYTSPSQCWGWQMAREKDFGLDERGASYVFRISFIFQGQERPIPNLASGVVQQSQQEKKL